jgi:uncharacterized protein
MADLELIPIFPLSTVLVPGMSLPLHIFETRYRQLVTDLLQLPEPERKFGVVAIKAGWEVGANNTPALHQIGTMAKVRKIKHLPEGTFDLTTTGADRFSIGEVLQDRAPYLMARVNLLEPVETETSDELISHAMRSYLNYLRVIGETTEAAYAQLPNQAGALANLLITTLTGNLPEQQQLLEMNSAKEKLSKLIKIFNRESILLEEIPSIPAPYLTGFSISLN